MFLFTNLEKHPYFNESIYNLLEANRRKNTDDEKPTRYRSKYNSTAKEEFSAKKSSIPRTMGYTHTPLRTPQDYLKKHSKEIKIDASKSVACLCRCKTAKESPRQPEASPMAPDCHNKRNFGWDNVAKKPRTVPLRRIDSRKGNAFELEDSGWVPKYCQKKDYGKIPSYIVKIQRNMEHSREEFHRFMRADDINAEPKRLSEESRQAILEGLVKNLKELLKRYIKIPLSVDTPFQIKKKEEIEQRIDAMQRDIDLIRENKDILIGRERPKTSFY